MAQSQLSQNLIDVTDYICLPLSIAGSIYIITSFASNPRKSFPAKLIVALAISNLILSLINFMDVITKDTTLCNIQAFVRSFGIYSQMLWATEILAILYLQFVWRVPKLDEFFWRLVLINVVIAITPSIITVISMNVNGSLYFGDTQGSCNILPLSAYIYLMVIPFGILVVAACFMTLKVYSVLKNIAANFVNVEYKNLFVFPACLLVLYLPAFFDFMIGGFVQGGWYQVLTAITLSIFKLVGFMNAIQYRRAFYGTNMSNLVKPVQQQSLVQPSRNTTYSESADNSFAEI